MRNGRAALVAGFCDLSPTEVMAVWRRLADGYGRVTVIAVADPYRYSEMVLAVNLFGMVVADTRDGDREARAEAARRVRLIVDLAPHRLAVEHLVVMSWPALHRHVGQHGYEHVLLANRPPKLRRPASRRVTDPPLVGAQRRSGRTVAQTS